MRHARFQIARRCGVAGLVVSCPMMIATVAARADLVAEGISGGMTSVISVDAAASQVIDRATAAPTGPAFAFPVLADMGPAARPDVAMAPRTPHLFPRVTTPQPRFDAVVPGSIAQLVDDTRNGTQAVVRRFLAAGRLTGESDAGGLADVPTSSSFSITRQPAEVVAEEGSPKPVGGSSEPSSLSMFGIGGAALVVTRARRRVPAAA